jgi:hypothetical protein
MVRKSRYGLAQYLAENVPCQCLDEVTNTAKQEDERAAAQNSKRKNCKHGVGELTSKHLTEEWKRKATERLVRFALENVLANKKSTIGAGTYRGWKVLREFFQDDASLACQDFAVFAFACAVKVYLQKKNNETCEQICNLAILAEVCANHGHTSVMSAMKRVEDDEGKVVMEAYLREIYIEMRKTNASSSLLRLMQKKVPCGCLDDIRGILHAMGPDRHEVCNICHNAIPKNTFKICSRCGIEEYCSKQCLEKDFKDHKNMCKHLSSAALSDQENN